MTKKNIKIDDDGDIKGIQCKFGNIKELLNQIAK